MFNRGDRCVVCELLRRRDVVCREESRRCARPSHFPMFNKGRCVGYEVRGAEVRDMEQRSAVGAGSVSSCVR